VPPGHIFDRVLDLIAADAAESGIDASDTAALPAFVSRWKEDPENRKLFIAPAAAPPPSPAAIPGGAPRRPEAPPVLDPVAELAAWDGMSTEERRIQESTRPGTKSRIAQLRIRAIRDSLKTEGVPSPGMIGPGQ